MGRQSKNRAQHPKGKGKKKPERSIAARVKVTTRVMDLAALLPDDALADVLRRLAPRDLAASRCVCKAWRAVVDERRLLRADLLPLSLAGILIQFSAMPITEFFSRPSTDPSISGKHEYLPGKLSWSYVCDHCNGLLLLDDDYVLNPATRWYAALPPCPPPCMKIEGSFEEQYLAYDPFVSPDYEVFSVPHFHQVFHYSSFRDKLDPRIEQSEWPPSAYILHVFSSKTGGWEERSFVREGEAAGTIADMRLDTIGRNSAYWRGSLYIHCQTNFVMRISLSNDTYQVIKHPLGVKAGIYSYLHLGKSEKGVYCALFGGYLGFQVWHLNELSCQTEWVLKHEVDLFKWVCKHNLDSQVQGPWILQDLNDYWYDGNKMETHVNETFEWSSEASDDEKIGWSSDNDDNDVHNTYRAQIMILGFHPFKEIIFFCTPCEPFNKTRALAYHWNISKFEDLGSLYPRSMKWVLLNERGMEFSFMFTPCWM
ncbi:hypothetical protein ACP70R_010702 [Stipagrostis hirtigluma subsp. patula]